MEADAGMKALSFTPPWGTLIALEEKRIETRTWYTNYRGLFAIHASGSFPKWARELCGQEPFYQALTRHGITLLDQLPRGCIIGVARIAQVGGIVHGRDGKRFVRASGWTEVTGNELEFGNYDNGRYALVIDNVLLLPEPVPCKGALNFWALPADVEARIKAQLW